MLAIIAGGGDFPKKLTNYLLMHNKKFVVLFLGEEFYLPDFIARKSFKIGQVGAILDFLSNKDVIDITFCGNISRPSFLNIKLDKKGILWLKELGSKIFYGDDTLLSGILDLLKKESFNVIAPHKILPHFLIEKKQHTIRVPTDIELINIKRGIEIIKEISKFDIGQSIVIQEGIVLGIEAIEGTSNLISRCGGYAFQTSKPVLVKASKKNQSMDIDVPSIGPQTFLDLLKHNYCGIAVESNNVQITDYDECIKIANDNKIFLFSY